MKNRKHRTPQDPPSAPPSTPSPTPSPKPALAPAPLPPSPNRPNCPRWLDKDAKAVWRWITPQLEKMGVLHKVDRIALGRYCQTYARWKRAEMFLQKHGEMYALKDEQGKTKYFVTWPQVAVANRLAQSLLRLEQEFGLTPSARTRIAPGVAARSPEVEADCAALWAIVSAGGPAPPRPFPAARSKRK